MKKRIDNIKIINEGIRYDSQSNSYLIDFNIDNKEDIIKLKGPDIYASELMSNVYWFGYSFDESVSRASRTKFINWLKGLDSSIPAPTEGQYERLISKPLVALDKKIGLNNIDLFVYPLSGRSNLVNHIIKVCDDALDRDISDISIEMIKNMPQNITFDWDRFKREFTGDQNIFKQMSDYIETLMEKIHHLDYFSIGRDVSTKYRRYIKDFLNIGTQFPVSKMEKAKSILIVDDISTSHTTLKYIINTLKGINNQIPIYIFTLIGKE